MKYKAFITDVDGTLVPNHPDGLPSQRNIEAIKKAKNILHVGVATARPLFMMDKIFKMLELSGPSIIMGGSQIYDATNKEIISEQLMDLDAMSKTIKILKKYTKKFMIHDHGRDMLYTPSYKPKEPLGIYMFALHPDKAEEIVQAVTSPEISVHKIVSHIKGKMDVEISDPKSTKQHGIFQVAEILGIQTHEIIGIGDSYNDFPLLMACGFKVAIGNAAPELKAIADYVAPTQAEDGVADVIEKFILN